MPGIRQSTLISKRSEENEPRERVIRTWIQLKFYADKLAYEIDSWDLKVALEAGEKISVIDARSQEAFQREHIPGAINIPHRTMSPQTTSDVDKNALVVTYCDGIGFEATDPQKPPWERLAQTKLGFRVKRVGREVDLDWWETATALTKRMQPLRPTSRSLSGCA